MLQHLCCRCHACRWGAGEYGQNTISLAEEEAGPALGPDGRPVSTSHICGFCLLSRDALLLACADDVILS